MNRRGQFAKVNIVLSPQEIDHDWAVKALARVTGVDVDADEFKTVAMAAAFAKMPAAVVVR